MNELVIYYICKQFNVYSLINLFPLSILGKNFSRRHFAIFLLFFPENRLCKIVAFFFCYYFFEKNKTWHFIWTRQPDESREMSSVIYSKNNQTNIKFSSAAVMIRL